jgi:imidazolonepropionase-like amidohydrolase
MSIVGARMIASGTGITACHRPQGIMNGARAGLDSIDHGISLNEKAADPMKAKGI